MAPATQTFYMVLSLKLCSQLYENTAPSKATLVPFGNVPFSLPSPICGTRTVVTDPRKSSNHTKYKRIYFSNNKRAISLVRKETVCTVIPCIRCAGMKITTSTWKGGEFRQEFLELQGAIAVQAWQLRLWSRRLSQQDEGQVANDATNECILDKIHLWCRRCKSTL